MEELLVIGLLALVVAVVALVVAIIALPTADPRPQIDDRGLVLRNFGRGATKRLLVRVEGPNIPGSVVEETFDGGLSPHPTGQHYWKMGWTRETIDRSELVLHWPGRLGRKVRSRWSGDASVEGGFRKL